MDEENRKQRSVTDDRDARGRFTTGNSGRPQGSRNRITAAAEDVIDDAIGEVARKCVELAKAGDVACIRALLRLRIPALRERSVQQPIELPKLETAQDTLDALRTIAEAAARLDIDPDQARALTAAVTAFQQTFQIVELDERIGALEAVHAKEERS